MKIINSDNIIIINRIQSIYIRIKLSYFIILNIRESHEIKII